MRGSEYGMESICFFPLSLRRVGWRAAPNEAARAAGTGQLSGGSLCRRRRFGVGSTGDQSIFEVQLGALN